MSDTPPYSEATVELVARAEYDADAAEVTRAAVVPWPEVLDRVRALYLNSARASLDALAAAGRLLPEGAETNVEYAVRFISQGGSHVVGAERQQQAHALASHHSRLPGCCGEVLRLTRYVVEEVEATYPGRSAVPPEPKEGT